MPLCPSCSSFDCARHAQSRGSSRRAVTGDPRPVLSANSSSVAHTHCRATINLGFSGRACLQGDHGRTVRRQAPSASRLPRLARGSHLRSRRSRNRAGTRRGSATNDAHEFLDRSVRLILQPAQRNLWSPPHPRSGSPTTSLRAWSLAIECGSRTAPTPAATRATASFACPHMSTARRRPAPRPPFGQHRSLSTRARNPGPPRVPEPRRYSRIDVQPVAINRKPHETHLVATLRQAQRRRRPRQPGRPRAQSPDAAPPSASSTCGS